MNQGLSANEVDQRQKQYGKNEITTYPSVSWEDILLSQFLTFINVILYIAAVSSFIVHSVLDGIFILAILILNALFGFFQEYQAEKSLEKLKDYTILLVRVRRDEKDIEIDAKDLVPDDIVTLSEGNRIPADGIIIQNHHLEIDESVITGESLAVEKKKGDVVLLGTFITKGKGSMKVIAIGDATHFGQVAHTLSSIKNEKTPLQKQLERLGRLLSLAAVGISLLLIPLGLLQQKALIPLLFLAVSIGVAAIPEALPAVVTIALAIGTNRLAKRKVIVRQMAAIETLGAMQYILIDKTGTLTQNRMKVKKVWIENKKNSFFFKLACIIGTTASLVYKDESEAFDIIGDKTDGALLAWAYGEDKTLDVQLHAGHITDEYVFDAASKTITTVWEKDKKKYIFVRGAPETIIDGSTLSPVQKEEAIKEYQSFAKEGLRVIGLGIRHESQSSKKIENYFTFLGFLGIYDPPRKEAKEALIKAQKAGIRVLMVTGDNELTALSIAQEVGLIDKEEDVITGNALKKLSDEELEKILTKTRIFARTVPEDKLRITSILKKQGFVVGVTGDGVNDALALKKADVGIAMGESGTDVAKEASDIILMDDNFITLIKAVEEGRTIYSNIVKALIYLLAGNLSELSLIFFTILLGLPSPLIPTQILWINLITDGLPALALATDSKTSDVLRHKPRNPTTPILTTKRIFLIFGVGFAISLFLTLLFTDFLTFYPEIKARTYIFHLLIFSQLILAAVLGRHSLQKRNTFFIGTFLFIIAVQIIITFLPFVKMLLELQM